MSHASDSSSENRQMLKRARLSTSIDRLPNEILVCIFKHMEAMELPVLMFVCKRWCETIRQNPTVWRSALDIGYGVESNHNVLALYYRLDKILRRSNGRLDHLALPLALHWDRHDSWDDEECPHSELGLKMLMERLADVNLRSLFISVHLESGADYINLILEHIHDLGVADMNVFAFGICPDHMEDEVMDMVDRICLSSGCEYDEASTPFTTAARSCRPHQLADHRLVLNGYWPSYITRTVDKSNVFANLSVLHIRWTQFPRTADTLALYKMLECVQDCLVELWMSPSVSGLPYAKNLIEGWHGEESAPSLPPRKIRFSKLRHLHIGCKSKPGPSYGHLVYDFVCPLVEFISLDGAPPLELVQNALPSTITSLRVNISTFAEKDKAQILQRCTGLPKLFVDLDLAYTDLAPSKHCCSSSCPIMADNTSFKKFESYLDALVCMAPAHLVLLADMRSAFKAFGYLIDSIARMSLVDKHAFGTVTLSSDDPFENDIDARNDLKEQLNRFRQLAPKYKFREIDDGPSHIFPPQYYQANRLTRQCDQDEQPSSTDFD